MNKQTLLCSFGALGALAAGAQEKPNIIYIMCDDMGYGDLACYGQQYIATPNIDRMAAEGMRFTQAYAGSPVSAPSRASFMTGQHTGHTHVRGNREYWNKFGTVQYGVVKEYKVTGQEPYDTAHVVIPEIMKDNGYTTGMFGKWAGGYEGSISTPDKRGVDEYYGYICQFMAHLYYPNFMNEYSRAAGDTAVRRVILEENVKYPMYGPEYKKRPQYSADLIHQKALAWLDKQSQDQPFFGVFTYTLPHAELAQPEDSILLAYRGKFCQERTFGGSEGSRYNPTQHGHAEFAAMITRLDAQVGEVLAKLKEKGLDENTIVIFTSDNGPHAEGGADPNFFKSSGPLRGIKRQVYEGGIRVPFVAWSPGNVPAGVKTDHMAAFWDFMPTMAELTGRKLGTYTDGISYLSTLLGKDGQRQHPFLYWEFHEEGGRQALRMGEWKLIRQPVNGQTHTELYHLPSDLHEDRNVAAEHPERVKEMMLVMENARTHSDWFDFGRERK